jgi:PAB-dependent poly(A)-specific ribonuclease subunit 2
VSISSRDKQQENQWHLFNDFLVRRVPDEEALRFHPGWKMPSILTYQVKQARHRIDDTWRDNLDTALLYRKWSPQQEEDESIEFRTLAYPTEKPVPGTPVGIDAEFVALQQEELEIKADGSRSIVRPSRLGLARVSVLRGGEELPDAIPEDEETSESSTTAPYIPFIDDYIHIQEPIIDYLTLYSGISPGDLSPKTSPYAATGRLVSLKTAYKKIWLLLNLGVVFVGHGLLKDFRTINIHIPKSQVVDTVDLYYLKSRGRKLSLRFLSWLILEEMVQTGNHDSVEDARTAIRLWREWQRFEKEGRCEEVLQEIYRRGRDVGFKVPGSAMKNDGRTLDAKLSVPDSESEAGASVPGTPNMKGRVAGSVGVAEVEK